MAKSDPDMEVGRPTSHPDPVTMGRKSLLAIELRIILKLGPRPGQASAVAVLERVGGGSLSQLSGSRASDNQ